jgi:hypothetical protein
MILPLPGVHGSKEQFPEHPALHLAIQTLKEHTGLSTDNLPTKNPLGSILIFLQAQC